MNSYLPGAFIEFDLERHRVPIRRRLPLRVKVLNRKNSGSNRATR